MTHTKSGLRLKCDICKGDILCVRTHTVVGFRLESGRQINACGVCIGKIGLLKLNNDNEGIDRFFDEAGIKID